MINGVNAPPGLEWQIGKTAEDIKFINRVLGGQITDILIDTFDNDYGRHILYKLVRSNYEEDIKLNWDIYIFIHDTWSYHDNIGPKSVPSWLESVNNKRIWVLQ